MWIPILYNWEWVAAQHNALTGRLSSICTTPYKSLRAAQTLCRRLNGEDLSEGKTRAQREVAVTRKQEQNKERQFRARRLTTRQRCNNPWSEPPCDESAG